MKMMIAILHDHDSDTSIQGLNKAGFWVTYIASTGGMLRRGMTTLLIGMDDGQVDAAIKSLRSTCSPVAEGEKRAIIFVAPMDRFERI